MNLSRMIRFPRTPQPGHLKLLLHRVGAPAFPRTTKTGFLIVSIAYTETSRLEFNRVRLEEAPHPNSPKPDQSSDPPRFPTRFPYPPPRLLLLFLTPLEEVGDEPVPAKRRVAAAFGVEPDQEIQQPLDAQDVFVAPGPIQEQLLQLLQPHLGRHGGSGGG
ncbi:hypothetical protein L345_10113, partial [Ophiophagus hannah]